MRNLLVFVRLHARHADRADAFVLVHDRQTALDENAGGKTGEARTLLDPDPRKNLLGRLVMAEVRALPVATSAVIAAAPSMRVKPSKNPPSSTIEIETAHLFLATASQAARIFLTSAEVQHCLVRMIVTPGVCRNTRVKDQCSREKRMGSWSQLWLRHAVREGRQRLTRSIIADASA